MIEPRDYSIIKRAILKYGSIDAFLTTLNAEQQRALLYEWPAWARPTYKIGERTYRGQMAPPGNWAVWLFLAGRGCGKTRSLSEWAIEKARSMPGSRGIIVAGHHHDTLDISVEGESGILQRSPPWFKPTFHSKAKKLTWPNGSSAKLYSAFTHDDFRGKQHHWGIADEIAKSPWTEEAWRQMIATMRLGAHPQIFAGTTPRKLAWLRQLRDRATTVVTVGRTSDNADFLPESYLEEMNAYYAGTTMGRQELEGELFNEETGSLWKMANIDKYRISPDKLPRMKRIVTGVDPSDAKKRHDDQLDEAGIVTVGQGIDGDYYVLADNTCRETPDNWATKAVVATEKWGGHEVAAETNRGGAMIPSLFRVVCANLGSKVQCIQKKTDRSKTERAEPIVALYEQGRVHHVGTHADLEKEMTQWTPDQKSPDRMDALVFAVAELAFGGRRGCAFLPS